MIHAHPGLPGAQYPAEAEQHSLLVLLDDPDGQPQPDHDEQDDDQ